MDVVNGCSLYRVYLYIDLYSPTCGSREKQKTYTHINTVKYNKQEKAKKN